MSQAAELRNLRRTIELAFEDACGLTAESLHEGLVLYQYGPSHGNTAQPLEERRDWRKLSDEYLEANWKGFTYLSSKSFVFYLPRFMVYFLDKPTQGNCEEMLDMFLFALLHSTDSNRAEDFLTKLTSPQLSAVQDFLENVNALSGDQSILRTCRKILKEIEEQV